MKVLITRAFQERPLKILKENFEVEVGSYERNLSKQEIIQKIKDKSALISLLADPIDKEVIESAPNLKIIAQYAVGYNNIDVEYALSKGIYITHTPDVLTEATAEIAFALMLSVSRRIVEADNFTRAGKFRGWEPNLLLGKELKGKTVGIIGFGRIGKSFAKKCNAFGMNVLYTKRNRLSPEEEKELNVKYMEFDELLRVSDVLSFHTPLTKETRHLLSKEKFNLLKEGVIIINTSRGAVIDENALVENLKSGKVWGAGLDVYENEPKIHEELLKMKNVVLLPHIGSATEETREKMAFMCVNSIIDFSKGKIPENLIPEWKEKLKI